MEPSTFFIDQEIKFKKADLEALKEDKDYSDSPWYRVSDLSNAGYCVSVQPSKRSKSFRKSAWIDIFVHLGRATNVDVDVEITIQNLPFYLHAKQTFNAKKALDGWGKWICTTSELFHATNNYFTDGEMTIKVKGTFRIELNRIRYPFAAQWKIKEENARKRQCIFSNTFKVSPNIEYSFCFYPNGKDEESNEAQMYLYLTHGPYSKVNAVWKFSVDSANFVYEMQDIFDDPRGKGWGIDICSPEELFDPEKGYFVGGELTLKVAGTVLVEKEKEPTILALEQGIVQKGYHLGKNFTFIVGGKLIKVHKHVLISASSVFAGMFESKILKEVKEKKIEIVDFDYEIVHAAVKLLYSSSLPQTFYFEQMLDLLRFSDKYDIILIKDAVQEYLIKRISPTNVCSLINFTSIHNAPKLLSCSREYLVKRLQKKEAVHGLETIDKNVMLEILLLVATKNA